MNNKNIFPDDMKIKDRSFKSSGPRKTVSRSMSNSSVQSHTPVDPNYILNGIKKILKDTEISIGKFPAHQHTPPNAKTFDMRVLADVGAGSVNEELMSYTVGNGFELVVTGFALFNDALLQSDTEFIPTVNEARVFQYHGDPNDNFRLSLGLGTSLSNEHLSDANLVLKSGQTFRMGVSNSSAVNATMGARIRGYIVTNTGKSVNFGG